MHDCVLRTLMPTNPVTTCHDFMHMLEKHIVFSNFFSKFMAKGFCKFGPCENMSQLESSGGVIAVLKCLQENKMLNTLLSQKCSCVN